MNKYLITFDLVNPNRDYEKLIRAIKQYPWAKICESAWAVKTTKSSVDLVHEFGSITDKDDKLFVSEIQSTWAANHLPLEVVDWLRND